MSMCVLCGQWAWCTLSRILSLLLKNTDSLTLTIHGGFFARHRSNWIWPYWSNSLYLNGLQKVLIYHKISGKIITSMQFRSSLRLFVWSGFQALWPCRIIIWKCLANLYQASMIFAKRYFIENLYRISKQRDTQSLVKIAVTQIHLVGRQAGVRLWHVFRSDNAMTLQFGHRYLPYKSLNWEQIRNLNQFGPRFIS